MVMQWIRELVVWWGELPRDMAFFFSLPFLVVAGAVLAHLVRRGR